MKRILIFLIFLSSSLFCEEEKLSFEQGKAPSANYIKEDFFIDMRGEGKAKAEAVYEYGGVYAQERRSFLDSITTKEQIDFYANQIKAFLGPCEKKDWHIQNQYMLEKPLIEKISAEALAHAVTHKYDAKLIFFEHEIFSLIPKAFIARGSEEGIPFEESYQFPHETTFELFIKVLTPNGYFFEESPIVRNMEMGVLEVEKNFEKNDEGFSLRYRLHFGEAPLSPEDALWTAQNLFKFSLKAEPIFFKLDHHVNSLLNKSQFMQALALYEEEAASVDATLFSFLRLATLYSEVGLKKRAKETVDLAVKRFPFSANSWLSRGYIYLQKEAGQMATTEESVLIARESFEKALFLDPYDWELREFAMKLFFFDQQGVYGRDPHALKRAAALLVDLISINPDFFEKKKEDCLFFSLLLHDKKLVEKILSLVEGKEEYRDSYTFFLSSFSAYYNGGRDELFNYLEKYSGGEKNLFIYKQIRSLAILFLQFGEPYPAIALFDSISKNVFSPEDSEKEFFEFYGKWIIAWETFEQRIFYSPLATIEARNNEEGAADWVIRFLYEFLKADPSSYNTVEPFFSPTLFQKLKDPLSNFSFDLLFKNLLLGENYPKGSFLFWAVEFLMKVDFEKTERLADNLYLVKSIGENQKELKFLVHWENGSFQIEAIEDFFPALGERIYRNLALNPSLVEGYLQYLDRVAYEESSIEQMSFSGLHFSPYLVLHKKFRNEADSSQWNLTLREKIQGFVIESGFETDEVKQAILTDLEKLSTAGDGFKNRWATLLLCFYYSAQNEAAHFKEAASRLSLIAKELPVTSFYHVMALLLEKEEEPVVQFIDDLKKQIEEGNPQALTDEEFRIIAYIDFSFFLNYDRMVAFLPFWEKQSDTKDLASFYNLIAWTSLFGEKGLTPKDFYYVRKGLELSENKDSAIIHTAATMYAQKGQNDEALKLLNNLDATKISFSPSDWYLYGLLMKNFGYDSLAQEAFEKCLLFEKPSYWGYPSSCCRLLDKMGIKLREEVSSEVK